MKAIKLAILPAVMLAAGISPVKAQTADEIIQKHIAAIGGTEAWNKISTIKRVGSMNIQGMDIGFTQTIANNKGMRTDISAMGTNGYIIMTPKEGWMYMPMQGMDKVTPVPPEMMKGAAEKLNAKAGMLADKSEIAKSEFVGKDTIDKMACLKVKITDKEGNVMTDFFDASTYYLVRTEMTVKKDDNEQEVALSYSDFKKQPEGIVLPMSMTSPLGVGDINFKSVEINKPVGDEVFKPTTPDKK